ncbi:condensation domain-containing protein [Streptomyces sp. M10(2022)]
MVTLSWMLPAAEAAPLLTRVPSLYFCNVNDVLLTGLVLAFAQWQVSRGRGDDPSLLVDLEEHGRQDITDGVELSRTVGWFSSIYPARLDAGNTDGRPVGDVLKQVKEQLRAIPDNGIGYGLLRHLHPHTGDRLAQLPRPQVMFRSLSVLPASSGADWTMTEETGALAEGSDELMPLQYALSIDITTQDTVGGPQLTITLAWPRELLAEGDVRELGDAWIAALNSLADHVDDPSAGGRTPPTCPWSPSLRAKWTTLSSSCFSDQSRARRRCSR